MNTFIADFQVGTSSRDVLIRQIPSDAANPVAYATVPQHMLGRLVFYSLYIIACFSVMIYWQIRKHVY